MDFGDLLALNKSLVGDVLGRDFGVSGDFISILVSLFDFILANAISNSLFPLWPELGPNLLLGLQEIFSGVFLRVLGLAPRLL